MPRSYFRPARPWKPYTSHADMARAYVSVPAGAIPASDSCGGIPNNCYRLGPTFYWRNVSCHNGTQAEAGRSCCDARTQWLTKWRCGGTATPPPPTSSTPCKGLVGTNATACCVGTRGNCKVGQHWSLNYLGGCTCALNAPSPTPTPTPTPGQPNCKGKTGQAAVDCCTRIFGHPPAPGYRWSLTSTGGCAQLPITPGSGVYTPPQGFTAQSYNLDGSKGPCKYSRSAGTTGAAAASWTAIPYGGTSPAQKVVTYTRSSSNFSNDVTARCADARNQWCKLYGKPCGDGVKRCFVGGADPCPGGGAPIGGGGGTTGTSTDADCDAWGGAKGVCIGWKSFVKGLEGSLGGAGQFGQNISGANLYPIILIGIGVFAVVFLLKGR